MERNVIGRSALKPPCEDSPGERPASVDPLRQEDVFRIVLATANVPVSIPRGRGRRVVTLYEAQIRRLAVGRVYRRAAVMDFIRLVHRAAAASSDAAPDTPHPPAVARLEESLERLRVVAASADASELDRRAATFYEMLLDTLGDNPPE
ncbi:hypothetical protein ASE70_16705 [Sphingomonas sp. Leaf22]|uniref:hypothetical protein n=1 Tax=Sphingomonas sp. Leaf22 TaxID=1735687 RepID=UPI0006F3482D|nr:hypothetical protein [Sphingomonas sp. Leaf22]KQM89207.1 hypothetical protein ASE70_16705 [Sphingomonas sp. Leaf22]